jgi:hypothetical protein
MDPEVAVCIACSVVLGTLLGFWLGFIGLAPRETAPPSPPPRPEPVSGEWEEKVFRLEGLVLDLQEKWEQSQRELAEVQGLFGDAQRERDEAVALLRSSEESMGALEMDLSQERERAGALTGELSDVRDELAREVARSGELEENLNSVVGRLRESARLAGAEEGFHWDVAGKIVGMLADDFEGFLKP